MAVLPRPIICNWIWPGGVGRVSTVRGMFPTALAHVPLPFTHGAAGLGGAVWREEGLGRTTRSSRLPRGILIVRTRSPSLKGREKGGGGGVGLKPLYERLDSPGVYMALDQVFGIE